MSKKTIISAFDDIALKLKFLAKEKEDVRRKLEVTAEKLRLKAKQLAVTAKGKEDVRRKLVVTAKKLRFKAKQLAVTAKEKEDVRRNLKVLAKEKEDTKRKLEVTAEKLRLQAKQLAVTAKEKEDTKRKLEVTAEELKLKAKNLAVTAKEKEDTKHKLEVTAEELRLKAKQLAVFAKEKEDVRRKLVVTAKKLKMSHETLEKKVRERTKDLEEVRAKDEAILASIGDGLVATDENERILLVNKEFEKMLGWKEGEAQGKLLSEVIRMVDSNGNIISESERLVTKTLNERTTTTTTTTIYYKRKDETSFPVSITVAPIFIGDDLIGAVEVFRDITKEKEIDKAKSEFMSLASHQLRTPLTAIRWTMGKLQKELSEKVDARQAKMLEDGKTAAGLMSATITTMLQISLIESGQVALDKEDVRLHDFLERLIFTFQENYVQKEISLEVNCDKSLSILTDPTFLKELLGNLISNAIKYTPQKGKIWLSVTNEDTHLRVDVEDTGYGIPTDQQKKIFSKFFRGENVIGMDTEGTGLGLYLVALTAKLLNAEVSFTSEQDKGTTFTLRFSKTTP
ncbi:MAG: ATP-binding protein [Candidatus Peregrinibacteria bacterium]|nr:ATP-binding protein [Candidatus Peregrinibacteria bacterium]